MIERLRAENGDEILRYAGCLLASRVDPRAEARAWADARLPFVTSVRTVVVLGLGSGHHVRELLTRTDAAVLVIEPIAALAAAAPTGSLDPDRVTIIHVATPSELRESDAVRRAVRASYLVLTHPASRALAPELFRDLHRQLIARDWVNLGWTWAMRGEAELTAHADAGAEPLSIHDLAQGEVIEDADERRAVLLKALRELVK